MAENRMDRLKPLDPKHPEWAVKAAEAITRRPYGHREWMKTARGRKTCEGIADLIVSFYEEGLT